MKKVLKLNQRHNLRQKTWFLISDLTAPVASLDVAPDGSVYVLEPHGLHKIARDSRELTSESLESYGYHEVGVSSKYLVLSQEYYRYEGKKSKH